VQVAILTIGHTSLVPGSFYKMAAFVGVVAVNVARWTAVVCLLVLWLVLYLASVNILAVILHSRTSHEMTFTLTKYRNLRNVVTQNAI